MKGGPEVFVQMLDRKNPGFAQAFENFKSENAGKTPEQIAHENGIDFNEVKNLFN